MVYYPHVVLTDAAILLKLQGLAKDWGGEIIEVDSESYKTMVEKKQIGQAPFESFGIGVNWLAKIVFCGRPVSWPSVVHEMGHIFACAQLPEGSEEWEFFGWELATVRKVGASVEEWRKANAEYVLDVDGNALGNAPVTEQRRLIEQHYRLSRTLGLVNNKGLPVAIR